MAAAGIEAHALVREFKGGVTAVAGIDLTVAPGEIYGFLGPNGAGKSTTVHMLTTLLPPTSGTARVAGYDIVKDGPKVRSAIGAALQEAALDGLLTGREHIRLQTALHGLPRRERPARARAPSVDSFPRRADDRPRPAEPNGALAGGRATRQGGRRHGLPDDAVPRGGRRPRRPRRDHRPRTDRRRGHSHRAEGRDRAADGRGDPGRRQGK